MAIYCLRVAFYTWCHGACCCSRSCSACLQETVEPTERRRFPTEWHEPIWCHDVSCMLHARWMIPTYSNKRMIRGYSFPIHKWPLQQYDKRLANISGISAPALMIQQVCPAGCRATPLLLKGLCQSLLRDRQARIQSADLGQQISIGFG